MPRVLGIDVGFKKCGFAIVDYTIDDDRKVVYELVHVEAICPPNLEKKRKLTDTAKCVLIQQELVKRKELIAKCDDICIELQIDHLPSKTGGKANGLMHNLQTAMYAHFISCGFTMDNIHLCSGVLKLALQVVDGVKSTLPPNMKYVQRKEAVRRRMREFTKNHVEFNRNNIIDTNKFFKQTLNNSVYDQCDAMAHAITFVQRKLNHIAPKPAKDKKPAKADKVVKAETEAEKPKRRIVKSKSKSRTKLASSSSEEDVENSSEPVAIDYDDSDLPETSKKLKYTPVATA